jgi:lipopolysaccharide/colanic/teichoic acid biosynthesis glycosyltransferase
MGDTAVGRAAQTLVARAVRRRTLYAGLKLAADWGAALGLLLLAAPVIAILAVVVKVTSPGPAFYSQVRLGRFGRPFRIYKLRTMTHECELRCGAVWASARDPRVTAVGKILRQTHLDELPQLWNVLRLEMSLIGPRPERPEIAANLARVLPRYNDRLLVRPGLTGLAQVQLPPDRSVGDVARKLSQDLFYVDEMCPLLDLRIAAATVVHLLAIVGHELSQFLISAAGQCARLRYPSEIGRELHQLQFNRMLASAEQGSSELPAAA